MTTWIITTGSSDVQLELEKTKNSWKHLYRKVGKELNNLRFYYAESDSEEYAKAPSRVLGLMYANQPDYYEDLAFPLLDTFSKELSNDKPQKIILLLTNQEDIFSDVDKQLMECPYWQDTIALQPLFEKYLKNKFPNAKIEFLELKPQGKSTDGLENWDATLELVREQLSKIKVDYKEEIYVSHQAGTPAISSAVQFVTLGKFDKRVNFLVSNEYEKTPAQTIESSRYLRGIQIQQAKGLIKANSPGAALKLLENIEGIDSTAISELEEMVEVFNLNRPLGSKDEELEIEPATQRIVDVLDLIGIFFNQKNYIQGIALLAAAQETFLKVALVSKDNTIKWERKGLISANGEEMNNGDILCSLRKIETNFTPWKLLKWSCKEKFKRGEHDSDIRNQLLHNLCGLEEKEVVQYLRGNEPADMKVMDAYNNEVKQPFFDALKLFNLPFTRDKLQKKMEAIANKLD